MNIVPSDNGRQRMYFLWVMWGAFSASTILYMVFPYLGLFSYEGDPVVLGILEPLFLALSGICLAIGSMLVRLAMKAKNEELKQITPDQWWRAVSFYIPAYIVRLAIFEVPAVFGLLIGFWSGEAWKVLPFGLASLIAMAVTPPSERVIRHYIEDAHFE